MSNKELAFHAFITGVIAMAMVALLGSGPPIPFFFLGVGIRVLIAKVFKV